MKAKKEGIDEIIQGIFDKRGFDVKSHRRSDLQRKISRRIDVLGLSNLAEYSAYLDTNPDEYKILFNTILENVSQFFRDPKAWELLKLKILPEVLKKSSEIRIWSAGCARGEEPYSLAIMLADMLDDDLSKLKISIYATDIDEIALKQARSGIYTVDQLVGMPEDMIGKYFSHRGDAYIINRDIRNLLILSRHNLVSDPPMSRMDLLICRNVLIYYDKPLQIKIISKLQYALRDTGYLWLGRAEILIPDSHTLKPVNTEWRIFQKNLSQNQNETDRRVKVDMKSDKDRLEQILQSIKIGLIILDEKLNIVAHNQAIQKMWGDEIVGKSLFELDLSYRPIDLKDRIENVLATGEPTVVNKAEYWITKDRRIYLKVEIIPLDSGAMVILEDVTERYEIEDELKFANKALETANERLIFKNNELEESNRKLQYINEELQSGNEELESMNEEMRVRTEEMNTTVKELSTLNQYYEIAINSFIFGIIVIDKDLRVRLWNTVIADIFGIKDDEAIGKSFMELPIGFGPADHIKNHIRDVIKSGNPVSDTLEWSDHPGRNVMLEFSINPIIEKALVKTSREEIKGLVLIVRNTT